MSAKEVTKSEWLGSAPEFDHFDEVIETDVIVCGAGIAGVSAVRTAAEEGAEVVLFEKCSTVQARSGQFSLIGGETIKSWGIDNAHEANEIVNYLMRDNGYRPKQRILKTYAENCGRDFDWYISVMPELYIAKGRTCDDAGPGPGKLWLLLMQNPSPAPYDRGNERYPCYMYTIQFRPGHFQMLKANMEHALGTGRVKAYFETPARRLIRDEETGRVTGVIAQGYDGRVIKATARRGVVLATGDYSGNADMLGYYCPWIVKNRRMPCGIAPDKSAANSGDGHRMGMWIGAKMEAEPHAVNAHNMGGGMGMTPFLLVDVHGERFVNEDAPGQQIENQIERLKDNTAWQFFDAGWPEQVPYMPVGHGTASQVLDGSEANQDLSPADGYATAESIEKGIERGMILRADTLEELIEMTGLPREQTLATIERYSALARGGRDEDFGKSAARMFPLEKAPYYACKVGLSGLLCCHSGLESDHNAHVYDENMDVIPGLYVAGNVQGNRMAVEYPTTIPGMSHAIALVFGRVAGRNAARGV